MRLHDVCFLSAVPAAVVGMGAGLVMGIYGDFSAAPAHAHLNLLAWVSMALMGLYYRGTVVTRRRLATTQVALGVAGFWCFPVALGIHLFWETDALNPLIAGGAVMAIASFVLFAAVVLLDIVDRALEPLGAAHAWSG